MTTEEAEQSQGPTRRVCEKGREGGQGDPVLPAVIFRFVWQGQPRWRWGSSKARGEATREGGGGTMSTVSRWS